MGGNLYTRHSKNLNHVHKDSKDILSVILILRTNFNGGETVFNDGENMNDIVKITHLLKHSHGRCVIFLLIKLYIKSLFGTVIKLFYSLSSTNQYFFTLCRMVQDFMKIYISSKNKKNILMMTGVYFSPNKRVERGAVQNIDLLIQIHIVL